MPKRRIEERDTQNLTTVTQSWSVSGVACLAFR